MPAWYKLYFIQMNVFNHKLCMKEDDKRILAILMKAKVGNKG